MYSQPFKPGDRVEMCEEFKRIQPPLDKFTYGEVIQQKRAGLLRVLMPTGQVISSAAKYWKEEGRK